MKNKKRTVRILAAAVILIVVAAFASAYFIAFAPNFRVEKETRYLYIHDRTNFDSICKQLTDSVGCKNLSSFKLIASLSGYPKKIRTGRYAVKPGMNNLTLLRNLRNGNQQPVRLTFNNIRFKTDLAQRLGEQLMCGKEALLTLLDDSAYCDSLGFQPQTIVAMFIPNTYEIYWNITPDKFMKRMKSEYDHYWTADRKQQAQAIGLTPIEVATLASIVEEETAAKSEYPLVAGVYINRLHIGMPLQSDPTVKFAVGDFSLHRILFEHLSVDSPYNTYKYAGLPPGPLRIPSISAMDAVLHYTHHDYIYMCAKEDFSGRHNYASTLNEHVRNANRYRKALDARNIH